MTGQQHKPTAHNEQDHQQDIQTNPTSYNNDYKFLSTGQQHRPTAQANSPAEQHKPTAQANSTGQQHTTNKTTKTIYIPTLRKPTVKEEKKKSS